MAPPSLPAPATSVAAVARDLNDLICFIHKESSRHFFAVADELDLSITHCKTLHHLDHHGSETSVKELAEMLGVSLPATSRTVESLLGRGLLARREDEHDRRVKRVGLTPAGHDAVMRLNGARLADLEQFVSNLTDRERRRVADALAALFSREEVAACRTATSPSPA
jgi:DNA-binding MarR family transcriptional regulator